MTRRWIEVTAARFLVIAIALELLSCKPKWQGVFINAMNVRAEVQLAKTDPTGRPDFFFIDPQKTVKHVIQFGSMVVLDAEGRVIAKSSELPLDPPHVYTQEGGHTIYFLIDKDGVWPIPVRFRSTWRAHIAEIKGQQGQT